MDKIIANIGVLVAAGGIGAAFTLGVAVVCKTLGWAPINITVINNPPGSTDQQ